MFDQFGNPIYGDQQSQATMNRAAYGDTAAAMMMGHGGYGGGYGGGRDLFSDIGSRVMPASYTPPPRVQVGYYGMYNEPTTFSRGMASTMGLTGVPRGTTALEHAILTAGDFGERVGGGTASAATMLAGTFGIGALMAPMMSGLGRMGGTSLGAALGMGSRFAPMMGTLGAGMGSMFVAPMLGMAMANQVMEGVGARRAIEGSLQDQSFRFVGAGSDMADPRLGQGASRQARMQMADFTRQMDISDPMINTKDLTQILSGGMQNGLFNDSGGSIKEFQKRFKDITEGVKSITSVLHQTLEQGLQTIKDLKSIGVDPSRVKEVVGLADMTGRMAGRTGSEMIGVGLQGAEMFRGTGISMEIGAQANMMNLARVRASRDAGLLSQEAVSQGGGEQAMAQTATMQGLAFSQSMFGRGSSAAFFNPATSAFGGGGGFNQGAFMQAAMSGGGDFIGQALRSAGNLGSPAALRTYQANQEKFMSEMGKAFGGRGLEIGQTMGAASMAAFGSAATGASREVEFVNALKQQGVSESDIERRLAELHDPTAIFRRMQESIGATRSKQGLEEASQNFVINRISRSVKAGIVMGTDVLARPIDQAINAVGQAAQDFKLHQIYGAVSADASGVDISGARVGAAANLRGTRISGRSVFAREAGEALMESVEKGAFANLGITADSLGQDSNGIIIGRRNGRDLSISQEQLERASAQSQVLGMGRAESEKHAQKKDIEDANRRINSAILSGSLGKAGSAVEMYQSVFGKDSPIIPANVAAMKVALGDSVIGGRFSEFQKDQHSASSAMDAASIQALDHAVKRFDTVKGFLGGNLAVGVAEKLAEASKLPAGDPRRAELESQATSLQRAMPGMTADKVKSVIYGTEGLMGRNRMVRGAEAQAALRDGSGRQALGGAAVMQQTVADEILGARDTIASVQSLRGQQEMGGVLLASTRESVFDKDANRQARAVQVAQKFMTGKGMLELTDEDVKTFEGTSIYGVLKTESSLINDLKGGKITDKSDFRKRISNFVSDKDRQDQLTDMFGRGGFSEVANMLGEDMQRSLATSKAVGSAAGSMPGGSEQNNAAANAITQTSINLTTLSVMQGLAAKLQIK